MARLWLELALLAIAWSAVNCDKYKIGVGIGDITGPAADINMV